MTTTEIALVREFATITIPASQALLDKVRFDLIDASDLDVCSADMAVEAQEIIGRLSTVHDAMDEERKETTKPLREGQAWVNEGYRPAIETLDQAILQLKDKLKGWNKVVQQRKADAEAKERAERKAKEQQATTNEAAARAKAESLIAQAKEAGGGGTVQGHLLLVEASQTVNAAIAARENAVSDANAPITSGISSGVKGATAKWKARLAEADPDAWAKLLLACANRPELRAVVRIDESGLNIFAQATKGNVPVPGVIFYEEESIRVSKKAV